jgi:hypothetical protein
MGRKGYACYSDAEVVTDVHHCFHRSGTASCLFTSRAAIRQILPRQYHVIVQGHCGVAGIRNVWWGNAVCGTSLAGKGKTGFDVTACALRDRIRFIPRCGSSEVPPITALLLERPFTRGVCGRGVNGLAKDDTCSKMTNASVALVSLTMLARKVADKG